MPKKDLLAFIVITSFLVAGWLWLKIYVLDQPQPEDLTAVAQQKDKKDAKAKDEPKAPDKDKEVAKSKDEVKKEPGKEPEVTQKSVPEEPPEDVILGDPKSSSFYILATLTTRGGGVRQLTLPSFEQADQDGQPVFNSDGTRAALQLIQDDVIVPSFTMYHYPDAAKEDCVTTLGQMVWKVIHKSTSPSESEVVFQSNPLPGYPGLRIIKTYSLKAKEYHIGLTIEIRDERDAKGKDKDLRSFRYQLAGSHGLPIEGEWYSSIYRTPMIGIVDNRGYLWRNLDETQYRISIKEGGDRVPPGGLGDSMLQYAGVATQYFASILAVGGAFKQNDPFPLTNQVADTEGGVDPKKVFEYCRPTLASEEISGDIVRMGVDDPQRPVLTIRTKESLPRTLSFIMLPRTKHQYDQRGFKPGDHVFVSFYKAENADRDQVATGIRAGNVRRPQLDDITVRGVSHALEMKPGDKIVHRILLYHGPVKVRLLTGVDPILEERYADQLHLRTMTDYRSAGPLGWFASKIMFTDLLIITTRFMHWLLEWLHWIVPNYGLSIILLTLLVRGVMFPISRRSALLSQRMQALGPEIKKVQEKYKNDPQAKTAAVMELYRKHGVNPFGSCLPMVMQLPFFLGLYYCLQESINFRLAGFLWMDNLAAPDMLVYWGESIPIISDPDNMFGSFFSFLYLGPFFNLLPVIAVTLMLVQQKLMTPPPADEQQEMQQKMMKYMFVFIGVMFYKVAAGLCVYFIVSSLWGLAERKMLPKKAAPAAAGGPGGNVATTSGPGGGNNKQARGKAKLDKKEKKPDTAMQKMKDWWEELLKQAQKK